MLLLVFFGWTCSPNLEALLPVFELLVLLLRRPVCRLVVAQCGMLGTELDDTHGIAGQRRLSTLSFAERKCLFLGAAFAEPFNSVDPLRLFFYFFYNQLMALLGRSRVAISLPALLFNLRLRFVFTLRLR